MLKKILITSLAISLISISTHANEREDINAMVKELDYLIEKATANKKAYGKNKQRVRFDYDAQIEQLKITRQRTVEFLNITEKTQFNHYKPGVVDRDLIQIKQ